MKKNRVLKFAALVLVLTLVTSSLVSGTYAKYTTSVTGTGTVTVAKWDVEFLDSKVDLIDSFDLLDGYTSDGVEDGLIAPGTSGSFSFEFDTDESQVARSVQITADLTNVDFLKFYSDVEMSTPITDGVFFEAEYAAEDDDDGVATVYWKWVFEEDDTRDTDLGIAADTLDITVTFTATQLDSDPT